MSSLILPSPQPEPFVEPYPSEMPKIHHAFRQLTARFENTKMDNSSMHQFNQAAMELFGEAGFEIDIHWDEVRDPITKSSLGVYMPEVTISGRTKREAEADHDRLKHEIRAGMADGKVGEMREDGTWREDPRKKSY